MYPISRTLNIYIGLIIQNVFSYNILAYSFPYCIILIKISIFVYVAFIHLTNINTSKPAKHFSVLSFHEMGWSKLIQDEIAQQQMEDFCA